MCVGRATPLLLAPLPAPSPQWDSGRTPSLPAARGAGRRRRRRGRGEVCFKKGRVAGAARVLATWERARRQREGGKLASPTSAPGAPGGRGAGRHPEPQTDSIGW